MKESIYLETTVVSYYTSKPSRDIIVLAHQEITRQWWNMAMKRYNVFISEIVVEEASFGDTEAARKRLRELKDFPHLELNNRIEEIAQIYMDRLDIPEKSFRDAAHLANGEIIKKLMKINESFGFYTPIICTPEELMEV